MPKNGTVEDIITALIKKAQLEDEEKAGPIRLVEIHGNKIQKELTRETQVLSIGDYVAVVAERVPEEDTLPPGEGTFVQAFHFHSEPSKAHGIPFKFQIIPVSANARLPYCGGSF